jgi:predicted GIY-YIG superfamily endonuclease
VAASISTRLEQHHSKFYQEAIDREKELKKSSRIKKIELIKQKNPEWKDLSDEVKYL